MNERLDELIDSLAASAPPVRPLGNPLRRALTTFGAAMLLGGLAVYFRGDTHQLLARYPGREALMAIEVAAMLATGVLAIIGAFFLSIPGRSRRWLLAPLPSFLLWLLLSGGGCYGDWMRTGTAGAGMAHSADCLLFIIAVSLMLGAPLIWRLSRAAPIEPLPVALLGGLGSAALAALLLQFFHPFAVTFMDLAVHLIAILLVMAATALMNRIVLAPA